MSKLRIGARGLPRWVAVIILYVFILSGLGFFIGYFVPKLSGDFARLFREAPGLFAKVNKDWLPRAGAWIAVAVLVKATAGLALLPLLAAK